MGFNSGFKGLINTAMLWSLGILTILNCIQFQTNISRTHVRVHTVNIILCDILSHLEFNQVAKNSLALCNPQFHRCISTVHLISRLNTDDSETRCFNKVHYIQMRSLSYGLSRTERVATRCPSAELILFPHHPTWPRDGSTSPFGRIVEQYSFPPSGLNHAITPHPTILTSTGNPSYLRQCSGHPVPLSIVCH